MPSMRMPYKLVAINSGNFSIEHLWVFFVNQLAAAEAGHDSACQVSFHQKVKLNKYCKAGDEIN